MMMDAVDGLFKSKVHPTITTTERPRSHTTGNTKCFG